MSNKLYLFSSEPVDINEADNQILSNHQLPHAHCSGFEQKSQQNAFLFCFYVRWIDICGPTTQGTTEDAPLLSKQTQISWETVFVGEAKRAFARTRAFRSTFGPHDQSVSDTIPPSGETQPRARCQINSRKARSIFTTISSRQRGGSWPWPQKKRKLLPAQTCITGAKSFDFSCQLFVSKVPRQMMWAASIGWIRSWTFAFNVYPVGTKQTHDKSSCSFRSTHICVHGMSLITA